jgi:Zn-dependent M16 (insulinase) family peptidase
LIQRGNDFKGVADDRLSIEVSKAQNDIPVEKRDGDIMVRTVWDMIQLDEQKSAARAISTLRQETLLNELSKTLEEDEALVVSKFEKLRTECMLNRFETNYSDQE